MKTLFYVYAALVVAPIAGMAKPTPVDLPVWSQPESVEKVASMAASRKGRIFMDEFLPSLFTRTLVLDGSKVSEKGVRWVFTGPRSGLSVVIRHDEVELLASYYDSYGLHSEKVLSGKEDAGRYPNKERVLCKVPYVGQLSSVTLTLDHRLSAELSLNGHSVHRGEFGEDLSRQQLVLGEKQKLEWQMLRPSVKSATVTVRPRSKHQTIIGWGGITSAPSYQMLSEAGRRQYWELLCEYGLNIQREYPAGRTLKQDLSNLGSMDAAIHHHYGDNFPNGETSDFEFLRLHRMLPESSIWFEYWWHQPHWTKGDAEAFAESIRRMGWCQRQRVTNSAATEPTAAECAPA